MKPLLAIKNVSFAVKKHSFFRKRNGEKILDNISFEVKSGEILGIAGPSGGGKTSLAKIMTGILEPTEGEVIKNFSKTKPHSANNVQLLFQNSEEIINPLRKTRELLLEALRQGKADSIDAKLTALLRDVNVSENLLGNYGFQLSGGQRQRVALARLLAVEPEILIMDEPFSAQDVESQLNLLLLLKKINSEKKITLICVSHQVNVLKKLTPRILTIKEGKLFSDLGER